MENTVINIVLFIGFGTWLLILPKQFEMLIVKYQVFAFKYLPLTKLVIKTKEEAAEPIFNERALRTIGFANYLGAVFVAAKYPW